MPKILKAARTVIINGELTAVLEVNKGEYYKIPGGGIKEGETDEQAAKREAKEEAGCEVEILGQLGDHAFCEIETDTIHKSTGYLVKVVGQKKNTEFEDHEKERGFKLFWITFAEAKKLFAGAKPQGELKIKINERDLRYLENGEKLNKEILDSIKMKNIKIK